MTMLSRCLKADFYKIKHTPILIIHLIIPLIGSLLFLAYYSFSKWNTVIKITSYFEVLAIAFPLLIGLICSMVISQEEQAGSYKELISATSWRGTTLISKILLLLLIAAFSVVLALGIFFVGFQFVLHEKNVSTICYAQVAGALIFGNIFLYIIHLVISLKLGRGASIGLGIAGSLIAALMMTGLGDECWKYVPWAWGTRLCDFAILSEINKPMFGIVSGELQRALLIIIFAINILLSISLVWFSRWES
ncbi:lantibiotic immunity ABC transporter MutG family permease subunit [Clostridium sediminicola]|uniref:lantibiotic immunity ABC transporter MutG family permease subunit n=1 Tax=Clostridium sediminicola TaxID=3114879 RepID=UPI0031F1DE79